MKSEITEEELRNYALVLNEAGQGILSLTEVLKKYKKINNIVKKFYNCIRDLDIKVLELADDYDNTKAYEKDLEIKIPPLPDINDNDDSKGFKEAWDNYKGTFAIVYEKIKDVRVKIMLKTLYEYLDKVANK